MTARSQVLVVDDDEDLRQMLALVLEAHGYHPIEAIDGLDALEKLRLGASPSVIVLDLRMPRMNGTEFLTELRAGSEHRDVPVIVITGDVGGIQDALAAGAQECLRKPIGIEPLLEALEVAMKAQASPG